MTPTIFRRSIAGDAFEFMIESCITSPDDLYNLDGETFLRTRDGIVETGDIDILQDGER